MATTFREFLHQKGQEYDQRQRAEKRREWVGAVENLMRTLRSWLEEADVERLLEIIEIDVDKIERGIGRYRVPGLSVTLGDRAVRLLPVARNVVGTIGPRGAGGKRSDGRVDITDGVTRYMLYRAAEASGDKWFIIGDREEATPFDRSRFEAMMQEFLA